MKSKSKNYLIIGECINIEPSILQIPGQLTLPRSKHGLSLGCSYHIEDCTDTNLDMETLVCIYCFSVFSFSSNWHKHSLWLKKLKSVTFTISVNVSIYITFRQRNLFYLFFYI